MISTLLFTALVGCAPTTEDVGTGTLDLSWTVGPDGCDNAGVVEVAVMLDGALMGAAPCSSGQTSLQRIEPGIRQMEVYGLDVDGIERYAAAPSQVNITEGKTTAVDEQVLSALTARLFVTWYFDNGRLCASNDVVDVEVSVWDDGYLAAETIASCDNGKATLTDLPSGSYLADVAALDADGVPHFAGTADVVVDKGDIHEIEVRLDDM